MTFSLQDWKSSTKNSFLKSHSYLVIVSPPAGITNSKEIQLRTESISLPGASFLSADNYRPYGSGKNYDIPYSYSSSEISCVHTIDSKADIYKTFFDWANLVSNIVGPSGLGGSSTDRKFTASYFDEYTVDMTIEIYNHDYEKKVKTIQLYKAYPKSIDQMQMSWATNDDIARLSITYYYLYYTVT